MVRQRRRHPRRRRSRPRRGADLAGRPHRDPRRTTWRSPAPATPQPTIAKSAVTERVRHPGGTVDWVVTVENVGVAGRPDALDARKVVLTDAAARWITDLVVTPMDGVGDWTCSASTCTTDLMPAAGVATFAVTGRLADDAPVAGALVNQVDVVWENDVVPGSPWSLAPRSPSRRFRRGLNRCRQHPPRLR